MNWFTSYTSSTPSSTTSAPFAFSDAPHIARTWINSPDPGYLSNIARYGVTPSCAYGYPSS
eukprot:5120966-Heterocapsa_arctica.AAC.1